MQKSKENANDKISRIEKDLAEEMGLDLVGASPEPIDVAGTIVPIPGINKIEKAIATLRSEEVRHEAEFQEFVARLQEQVSKKETERDEKVSALRIRSIELNGALKFLKNELI